MALDKFDNWTKEWAIREFRNGTAEENGVEWIICGACGKSEKFYLKLKAQALEGWTVPERKREFTDEQVFDALLDAVKLQGGENDEKRI